MVVRTVQQFLKKLDEAHGKIGEMQNSIVIIRFTGLLALWHNSYKENKWWNRLLELILEKSFPVQIYLCLIKINISCCPHSNDAWTNRREPPNGKRLYLTTATAYDPKHTLFSFFTICHSGRNGMKRVIRDSSLRCAPFRMKYWRFLPAIEMTSIYIKRMRLPRSTSLRSQWRYGEIGPV